MEIVLNLTSMRNKDPVPQPLKRPSIGTTDRSLEILCTTTINITFNSLQKREAVRTCRKVGSWVHRNTVGTHFLHREAWCEAKSLKVNFLCRVG
jgi:hypothetical protein